jgi:hypothetical protein
MAVRDWRKLGFAAVCILVVAGSARADSQTERETFAATELSDEMLECSVYFRIAAACLQNVPDTRVPQAIKALNDEAVKVSRLAQRTGADVGMSREGQRERSKALHGSLMGEIHNTCEHISILLHTRHTFCERLIENPDPRFAELLQHQKKCVGSYKC